MGEAAEAVGDGAVVLGEGKVHVGGLHLRGVELEDFNFEFGAIAAFQLAEVEVESGDEVACGAAVVSFFLYDGREVTEAVLAEHGLEGFVFIGCAFLSAAESTEAVAFMSWHGVWGLLKL